MAKKGRGRGSRGGGSDSCNDSPSASPAARGKKNRGRSSRGHMGFSTGAFGVMGGEGDDSLNNSDAGQPETEEIAKKIHHTREERVDVHMEGGGNAKFYSDLSCVHVQSTTGRPVHISVGNKEEIAQRYSEQISLQEMEQGAIRSMHCDDKMMHHRLSKMSINSNADEFIFVGGRPSDLRSTHSHERSHDEEQIPEIQINGEPVEQGEQGMRYRSHSMSHNNQEAYNRGTSRSTSQFNVVRGPVIEIERHSNENYDQEAAALGAGDRALSHASVRSHVSGRNVPIELEFGGPAGEEIHIGNASRTASRVSVRSAHQENYEFGQNQDNLGIAQGFNNRARSVSMASVRSRMSERDIPIEAEFGGHSGAEIVIPGGHHSRPVSRASARSARQENYGFNHEFNQNQPNFGLNLGARSASRASVRSHMSERDIPVEAEFGGHSGAEIFIPGGHQSRPVSRASARSARQENYGSNQEYNQNQPNFGLNLGARSVSRASVHSHISDRDIPIDAAQFGGPAGEEIVIDGGRPVSRASQRSRFGQDYYGLDEHQDNFGFGQNDFGFGHDIQHRSMSRGSVRSNFGREVVLDDDANQNYHRARTISRSSDPDQDDNQSPPQFGADVSMEYGAAFDNRARVSTSNVNLPEESIGLNTSFNKQDSASASNDEFNAEAARNFHNGGDAFNFVRSASKISINSGEGDFPDFADQNNLNVEFDEGVRSRSHSRLDLRPEADEMYEHDVSGVSCGKGLPAGFSGDSNANDPHLNVRDTSRPVSRSSVHSRINDYQQQGVDEVDATGRGSRLASRNENPSDFGTGQPSYGYGYQESHVQEKTRNTERRDEGMMEFFKTAASDGNRGSSQAPQGMNQPATGGYVQGDYHNLLSSQSQSSAWSHSVAEGKEVELKAHFEDVNAIRSTTQTTTEQHSYHRSTEVHGDFPRPDSRAPAGTNSNFGVRAASRVSIHSTDDASVFGSTAGLNRNRPEGVLSAASQSSTGVAYHPVPTSRSNSQISIHSQTSENRTSHDNNEHQMNFNANAAQSSYPPASRISLLTTGSHHSDPTRISMKEHPSSPSSYKSRQQSLTQKPTNISSAHVLPILKLPPKASLNVQHKSNVGFSAMPELFSHPDDKFGASPGVKYRSTAEHEKTPARPRSTSVTIGVEPAQDVIPPRPAPRTSVTSIPDISLEIKLPAPIQTPLPRPSAAVPAALIYTNTLTPHSDRMSLGDYCCDSPAGLNVTQITVHRTASMKDNQPKHGVEISTQTGGTLPDQPKEPSGVSSSVPAVASTPASPLIKPTFNNSFESRGHPGANALNAMFANRVAAKEDASSNYVSEPHNTASLPAISRSYQTTAVFSRQSAIITQADYNSNEIIANKNIAPVTPEIRTASNLRNLALHESKIPSTPKTSRTSVFKKSDRISGMAREPAISSGAMWKPPVASAVPKTAGDQPLVVPKPAPIDSTKAPFAPKDTYTQKPQEALRKLPQQTWIVYNQNNSPPKENHPRTMKPPGGGDCLSPPQIIRPKEPRHMKPPGYEHVVEKPVVAAWNRPSTPPPPVSQKVEKPKQQQQQAPVIQASNSKLNVVKKAGDTVRQNLRPGQIRNLASMFDHIQAKASEEEQVLRGNSLRSSVCSRARHNSEPNESLHEDFEDRPIETKDDSYMDRQPIEDHYRAASEKLHQGGDFTDNRQGVFWSYENAGLHNALSDYDDSEHLRFRNAVSTDFHDNRRQQYFEERSLRSEDPAIQSSFEDGRQTPRGSVKALAAGFETGENYSPAQQRRNTSQASKASEHLKTAREMSRHEASSSSRFSHHANHSSRFDHQQQMEEPSYAKVQKKERIREDEYVMMMDDRHRYAEIRKERREEDDYCLIPERRADARSTVSMRGESNYGGRTRGYEENRCSAREEGDYCVIRDGGRRVSGRYDDVAEDKSVNGHIDNLFGFVDEHLGSEKLMSSREVLSSDNEEVRRGKPLTYSMSGYRAIQRNNRRNTSTVTRDDILAAHQKASSQAGTMASRQDIGGPARFSPTAAPNAAELSQQGGVYGKANSTATSGKRYVVGSALATSTPQQSPRNTVSQYATTQHQHSRMEDTSFVSSITDVSRIEVDYKQQIARLEHIVKMNNQQISMLYKALSQARKESKPIQEMSAQKTLLIAKERVALLQREIKRLQALSTVRRPPPPQSRDVRGSLTISNVAIHLSRSFYTRTYELNCSYTFVVLFKCGTEVEAMAPVTLLANHQNRLKTIHFSEKVNFSNLPVDFCVLLEVYALALSENKQEEQSCASAFASRCRNLLPKERKALTSPSGFPIGEFVRCGYIQLTRDTTSSTKFYLDETEYPLDGTIDINSHCTTLPPSIEVDYRGFLTMYQSVSGMSSWERYWAVLRRGTILFWKYPDDESMDKQPKARLDLSTCTQNEVVPCTPELCPRPFTFTVNILFPTAPSVMDKKRLFLSADSRELLKAWLDAVNETLSIIRG